MRIAALYDIHGNLPALEAVVDEAVRDGVDQLVFGGDVILGPMPRETFEWIAALDLPKAFISGNCDRAMLEMLDGETPSAVPVMVHPLIRWTGEQLSAPQIAEIRRWPPTLRQSSDSGDVLFVHATPRNDTEIFLKTTDEILVAPIFTATGAARVLCGHTHMPFDRTIGGVRVVNAGSVGMSFAGPGACWAVIDGSSVELRRTAYDLESAAARIRETAYPQAEEFATGYVLNSPSEAATLERYGVRS